MTAPDPLTMSPEPVEGESRMNPILQEIEAELARAVAKFPTWPTSPFDAKTVISEEYGELSKAILQHVHEPHKGVTRADIREEALQTAAMCVRFVISLDADAYDFTPGAQHEQTFFPSASTQPTAATRQHQPGTAQGLPARQEHSAVLRAAGIPDDSAGGGQEHSEIMRAIGHG